MPRYYTAVLERDAEGYSVYFPDVPGCVSAGNTAQNAAANAEEALYGHLILSLEHGEPLPDARPIDDIPMSDDGSEVARIMVRFEPPGKSIRVSITLPETLLHEVDAFAEAHGYSRSGLLAYAVREQMHRAS